MREKVPLYLLRAKRIHCSIAQLLVFSLSDCKVFSLSCNSIYAALQDVTTYTLHLPIPSSFTTHPVGRHAWFVGGAVQGVEQEIEGITDGATHDIPEFWRESSAERMMWDRGDVYVGDGPGKCSWCSVGINGKIGGREERVKGTLNIVAPSFSIAAVATTAGLLGDEEADVVVLV